MNSDTRTNSTSRWLRWTARIWSIPLIAYTLLLAIGYTWSFLTTGSADPYAVEDVHFGESLQPIFLGLSILALAIAWRWERIGAVTSLSLGAVVILLLLLLRPFTGFNMYTLMPFLLTLAVIIPGVLFLVSSSRS